MKRRTFVAAAATAPFAAPSIVLVATVPVRSGTVAVDRIEYNACYMGNRG